jgi:hypothetical protein
MSASSNRLIGAILVVAALAIAFWLLALGPKRQEAGDLAGQVGQLRASVAEAQSQTAEAAAARREFPTDYQQLVVLGKAVPADDDTSSLFVELSQIAGKSKVKFNSIELGDEGGSAEVPAATPTPTTPPATPSDAPSGAVPAAATVPPTEAAASLLPLGASIGPAGLGVMHYKLDFSGNFFHFADFVKGIDSLVHTGGPEVAVDGRLATIDGFALTGDPNVGFPQLDASFAVTTYLTPPTQGVTAGATPTAPAPSGATPAGAAPAAESAATPTPVSNAR